jgi:hypothetical protein
MNCGGRFGMPVKYIVLDNGNFYIEVWVGEISHYELIDHEKKLLNDTSISKGASGLVEARTATFSETALDMIYELSDVHGDPNNKTNIARCALLVSSETWPKAKEFEKQASKHGVSIISFNDLDIACGWLGVDHDFVVDHIKKINL